MSTSFPGDLDTLTNPVGTDPQNNPDHAAQHANANDAIEALEAKVGKDSSAVITSLDYLVKNPASVDPGHHHSIDSIDGLAAALTALGGGSGTKLYQSTAQVIVPDLTTTTLYTVPIPAGTLGISNSFKFRIPISSMGGGVTFVMQYGVTTVGTIVIDPSTTNQQGYIEGIVMGNGATNAQKAMLVVFPANNNNGSNSVSPNFSDYGSAAENSAIIKDLVISVTTSGGNITTQGILLEAVNAGTGLQAKKTTIATVNVLTLNGSPIEAVAAPASGHVYEILSVVGRIVFNSIAYTTNLNLQIKVGSDSVASNSSLLADTTTKIRKFALSAGTLVVASAITISVATGNPAVGNSPIDIYITYRDIEL